MDCILPLREVIFLKMLITTLRTRVDPLYEVLVPNVHFSLIVFLILTEYLEDFEQGENSVPWIFAREHVVEPFSEIKIALATA